MLTYLDRPGAPAPTVHLADERCTVLSDVATLAEVTSLQPGALGPVGQLHISKPPACDDTIVLRITPTEPGRLDELQATLTTATGQDINLHVNAQNGLSLNGSQVEATPRWLDIELRADSLTVATQGAQLAQCQAPGGVVDVRFGRGAPLPNTTVLHQPSEQGRLQPEATMPWLTHLNACLQRTTQIQGWAHPTGEHNALRIVAGRKDARPRNAIPRGTVEILGFLSEGWEARIASDRWRYVGTNGWEIMPSALEALGRRGALVAYVTDRRWAVSALDDAVAKHAAPQPLTFKDPPVFDGPRAAWMAGIRDVEIVLYQLSTLRYLQAQSDSADGAEIQQLEDILSQLWHPRYADYLDVVGIAARAMGRFRHSDHAFEQRGPETLHQVRDRLHARGITSSVVMLT